MVRAIDFEIRCAGLADVQEIAAAHLDSIRSIGALYYPAEVVSDWGARVNGDLYVEAMHRGHPPNIGLTTSLAKNGASILPLFDRTPRTHR